MKARARDTIRQLWIRKAQGYKAGSFSDEQHIALAAEGGGMRGVATGGMVSAIEDLGLSVYFDSVHGSSAGGAACAYFVAGQANLGTKIFYEDLNDNRFIDKRRLWKMKAVMDREFLVDEVMMKIKPINFERVASSRTKLHLVCTDIDEGSEVIYSKFDSYEKYRDILKASISLPFVAGGPVVVDGKRFMDGGLRQQIAVGSALKAGASMVLSFQTRRENEQISPTRGLKLQAQAAMLQSLYGGRLRELYLGRNILINETIALIEGGEGKNGQVLGAINLRSDIHFLNRLTKDRKALKRGAEMTKEQIKSLFLDAREQV